MVLLDRQPYGPMKILPATDQSAGTYSGVLVFQRDADLTLTPDTNILEIFVAGDTATNIYTQVGKGKEAAWETLKDAACQDLRYPCSGLLFTGATFHNAAAKHEERKANGPRPHVQHAHTRRPDERPSGAATGVKRAGQWFTVLPWSYTCIHHRLRCSSFSCLRVLQWQLLRVAIVALENDIFVGRLFFGDPATGKLKRVVVHVCNVHVRTGGTSSCTALAL